jgi:hypothetical protein
MHLNHTHRVGGFNTNTVCPYPTTHCENAKLEAKRWFVQILLLPIVADRLIKSVCSLDRLIFQVTGHLRVAVSHSMLEPWPIWENRPHSCNYFILNETVFVWCGVWVFKKSKQSGLHDWLLFKVVGPAEHHVPLSSGHWNWTSPL